MLMEILDNREIRRKLIFFFYYFNLNREWKCEIQTFNFSKKVIDALTKFDGMEARVKSVGKQVLKNFILIGPKHVSKLVSIKRYMNYLNL